MIDERKICFIICSNKEYYLEECLFYINQLEVPEGYTIDFISISEAQSMTSGYNEGMNATDAKYKIYMHQDVFILYKGFLQSILDIFHSDSSIGMIGMIGATKMSVGGVMWHSCREGMLYGYLDAGDYNTYKYRLEDGLHEVEAIDGLMMITCEDIPWREDKFDGWDFYDVSQSLEFRRQGWKIVVPEQMSPWCKHDDGVVNLINYNKYRKICMAEYPEYFYPEKFYVKKVNVDLKDKKTRVVIIARNQFDAVKSTIESLKIFSGLEESQLIVVDNGSEDGLRHWLPRQKNIDYIICGEVIEGYAEILNEVTKQFIQEEDLLILSAGMMMLPGCVEALRDALKENKQAGAVCARSITNGTKEGKSFSDAAAYAMSQAGTKEKNKVIGLPYEAVLIRNEMLRKLEGFDSRLVLPKSAMVDFAFRGVKENYCYFEIQNAFVYKISNSEKAYIEIFGKDADRPILKQKWEMNYFNEHPNFTLLSCIEKQKEELFNVLEIGCDCGVNLLHLKNEYPNVKLYGVEINSSAADIAAHIARVQVANIEEKSVDFEGIKFDYIMFGDVLEHLRDPEGTIRYCKELLKEDGRIIACIPNLMHYTVMRQLLDGNFTYTDMGLLDRTHIHLFTFNEIVKMFIGAGYEMDKMTYTGGMQSVAEDDKAFVNKLLSLSTETEEFMFYAFQYIISAKRS